MSWKMWFFCCVGLGCAIASIGHLLGTPIWAICLFSVIAGIILMLTKLELDSK